MPRHLDRRAANHDAAAERQRHRHPVPGIEAGCAGVVRAAQGTTGTPDSAASCATPASGLTPRASRPIRRYANQVALPEHRQQIPQAGRTASRRRTHDRQDAEAPHDGADELSVAVLADQGVDRRRAVERQLAGDQRQSRHQRQELVPEGKHRRGAGTVRPKCSCPSSVHRVVRSAKAR